MIRVVADSLYVWQIIVMQSAFLCKGLSINKLNKLIVGSF